MATRRPLTTAIMGHGRVPSSFRYINHLKSFRIPHSTLAVSSGPSVPLGADCTVNIQLVVRSVLPKVSHPSIPSVTSLRSNPISLVLDTASNGLLGCTTD